jgi:two-component sensor histidine kinase
VALIINELVTNAAKHTADGALHEIAARLECEADSVQFSVTNPGVFPDGFDFARGKGLGTGLGLVRSLLPLQGASLEMIQEEARVIARLRLRSPVLEVVFPPGAESVDMDLL